jgi:hypothetical protein
MEKLSRRQLIAAATGTAAVLSITGATLAQTPLAQKQPAEQDFDKAARESHLQNSATLAKFDIPMSLEPAFQFRA